MKPDYYQILGITPQTADKEIRRVYYKLAQKYHPDKAKDDIELKECEEKFALISEAYNVLKDPQRRKEYDKSRNISHDSEHMGSPIRSPGVSSAEDTVTGEGANKTTSSVQRTEKTQVARRAFHKGLQAYQLGEFARSVDFFEVAYQSQPTESRYLTQLALALVKSRKGISRAVELCKKAIDLQPYNTEHKLRLAEIYETIGSISLAKKMYEEVIHWDNNNIVAQDRLTALGFTPKESKSIFRKLLHIFQKGKFY